MSCTHASSCPSSLAFSLLSSLSCPFSVAVARSAVDIAPIETMQRITQPCHPSPSFQLNPSPPPPPLPPPPLPMPSSRGGLLLRRGTHTLPQNQKIELGGGLFLERNCTPVSSFQNHIGGCDDCDPATQLLVHQTHARGAGVDVCHRSRFPLISIVTRCNNSRTIVFFDSAKSTCRTRHKHPSSSPLRRPATHPAVQAQRATQ